MRFLSFAVISVVLKMTAPHLKLGFYVSLFNYIRQSNNKPISFSFYQNFQWKKFLFLFVGNELNFPFSFTSIIPTKTKKSSNIKVSLHFHPEPWLHTISITKCSLYDGAIAVQEFLHIYLNWKLFQCKIFHPHRFFLFHFW